MNLLVAEQFGENVTRLPLKKSATIVHGNALRISWNEVIPASELDFMLGNPPFSGAMVMDDNARESFADAFSDLHGAGVLDFVAAWYWLSAKYIQGTNVSVGLVSTNSICQGEQVGLLWRPMLDRYGVKINFAHRTFKWRNEAPGMAAVHCVIIGFALHDTPAKTIYTYETPDSDPHAVLATNINPYLVDAPNILLQNRSDPIGNVPGMRFGNMPRDNGELLLSPEERAQMIAVEPRVEPWIRRYIGADDFLNGGERWCLWLLDAGPATLSLPPILDRLVRVKHFRESSKAASTRKLATTPGLFAQIAQPTSDYLLFPRVSSENRRYIPIGFIPAASIISDSCLSVENATLFHFGVLSSQMHMAWVKYTCGRLKSDFRYSKDIVYNNFPWPELPETDSATKHIGAIEAAATAVLDARSQFPEASLATLYRPTTTPHKLVKAHEQLDHVTDAAYLYAEKLAGRKSPKLTSDADRLVFLLGRYQALTSLLPPTSSGRRRPKKIT